MRAWRRTLTTTTLVAVLAASAPMSLAQQEERWDHVGDDPPSLAPSGQAPFASEPMADLEPGQRPAPGSDEDGLWYQMDRVERQLRTSGRVVTDPMLQAYVEGIVCRLAPEHCPNIRVYIVRTPHFNATMAPNGVMQVWTGLLLRMQNESQLAYVLAHELAHYVRRHSLQNWRRVRDTGNAMAFFGLLTAAAGVGFVGSIGQLIAASTLFAYNRDQEREADDIGIRMMTEAGYDPREASKAWSGLMAERGEDGKENDNLFFATHPPLKERIVTLSDTARVLPQRERAAIDEDKLSDAAASHRVTWFQDELLRREPKESQRLLGRLLADDPDSGFLRFMYGEAFRLEYSDKGNARALEELAKALSGREAPPEALRSMGLIYWDMGDTAKAAEHFRRYLAMAPGADDRDMVSTYLKELKQ